MHFHQERQVLRGVAASECGDDKTPFGIFEVEGVVGLAEGDVAGGADGVLVRKVVWGVGAALGEDDSVDVAGVGGHCDLGRRKLDPLIEYEGMRGKCEKGQSHPIAEYKKYDEKFVIEQLRREGNTCDIEKLAAMTS